ncbi:hypothetical protein D3C78_1538850 [compost metagenome]
MPRHVCGVIVEIGRALHDYVPRGFGTVSRDQDQRAFGVDPGIDGQQVPVLAVKVRFAQVDTCRHAREIGRLGTESARQAAAASLGLARALGIVVHQRQGHVDVTPHICPVARIVVQGRTWLARAWIDLALVAA